MNISDTERQILLGMAGYTVTLPWGPAVGAALEYLVEHGYVHRDTTGDVYTYLLTQKGVDFVANTENGNAD